MGTHYPLVYRFVHTDRNTGFLNSLDDGPKRESCAVLYPCFAVDYHLDGKAAIYVAKYVEAIAPVSARLDVFVSDTTPRRTYFISHHLLCSWCRKRLCCHACMISSSECGATLILTCLHCGLTIENTLAPDSETYALLNLMSPSQGFSIKFVGRTHPLLVLMAAIEERERVQGAPPTSCSYWPRIRGV